MKHIKSTIQAKPDKALAAIIEAELKQKEVEEAKALVLSELSEDETKDED